MYNFKKLILFKNIENLPRPSKILFINANLQIDYILYALRCGHNVSIAKQLNTNYSGIEITSKWIEQLDPL
jgi:hypothetical protein